MKRLLLSLVGVLLLVPSCKKSTPTPTVDVTVSLAHVVDNTTFLSDTIGFINEAGNQFSITRLEYYLSDLTFRHADGKVSFIDDVFYVNVLKPETHSIKATLPVDNYTAVTFFLGLPADKNISYSLPATTDNVNMAWPEVMGGGYHFMKLEGHYLDDQSKEKGYAMHLGMNEWLVTVNLSHNLSFNTNSDECTLTMDISEWFKNPHTYNFNVQGNYTMGIDSLMQQLSENSPSAFSIHQNP